MRKVKLFNLIFVTAILLLLAAGCKKRDIPVLVTAQLSDITVNGATGGGKVTDDGNSDISARGVCWSTEEEPNVSDLHTTDATGTGSFTSTITGLDPGTAYKVRAYATNKEGTGYGRTIAFITSGQRPLTATLPASDILTVGATLNGLVNANDLSTVVSFEYGPTTSYGSSATAQESPVTGQNSVNASADITGLNPGTTYHFRIKSVNSLGTSYGDDKTFVTLGQAPAAVTLDATNILVSSATLNGTVNANLVSTTVSFEYGLTTSYGQTAAASPGTVTGSTVTNVSADLTGLNPCATYHFRVKAVNAAGTTYGADMTFVLQGDAPLATTKAATNVLALTATVNGSVNAGDLSTEVTFEYGLTTSYGSTATATQSPVAGTTITDVSADLTNLTPGAKTYHFRVKAVNAAGTVYGEDMTFVTLGDIPLALTGDATNITSTSVTLNGAVIPYDLLTVVTFDYGLTLDYGNTVTTAQSPISGGDPVDVTAAVSGLIPGTLYYYRIRAVNALGAYEGDYLTFTTGTK